MTTTHTKFDLTSANWTHFASTILPTQIQHTHGSHGNALSKGQAVAPPTGHPGPKPNWKDLFTNFATGKVVVPERLKYLRMEFTKERKNQAEAEGTKLDPFDLDPTPQAAAAFKEDTLAWNTADKQFKSDVDSFNKDDKGLTLAIIGMLGDQALAKMRTNIKYASTSDNPADKNTATNTSYTLYTILVEEFASGDTADTSTAIERFFEVNPRDHENKTIFENILMLDELSAAALAKLTDEHGNIKAETIKSYGWLRFFSKRAKQPGSPAYLARFIHRALLTLPEKGSQLPTTEVLKKLLLEERNMSSTIDQTDPPESEMAAAFAAQTTAQTAAQTALTTSKKSDKSDCKWCLEKFGIHRQGHLAGACSNNPANAGKPRPPPRHPKGGRPAAGHIANAGAAAATAPPPQSPSPAGSPADNNSSNTYWQLEQAKTQGKFDALLALMTTSSSSDYHGSTAGSVITQGA